MQQRKVYEHPCSGGLGYRAEHPRRRSSVLRRNRDATTGRPFELDLATGTATAGGRIEGELRGLTAAADVTLLRIEVCPAGRLATSIGSCRVDPQDGRAAFRLELSPEMPPSAAGPKCRLGFAVRA